MRALLSYDTHRTKQRISRPYAALRRQQAPASAQVMRLRVRASLAALAVVARGILALRPEQTPPAGARLEALVVGTVARRAYLDVVDRFIARHVRTHVFTEADVAPCVVCHDRAVWQSPPYEAFGLELDVKIWADRSDGWWCAQARPTAALAAFLSGRGAGSPLPQYLLVMDDDTWVHLGRLRALLADVERVRDVSAPLYLGFTGHQFRQHEGGAPFCYGGAGYVLNAVALAALQARAPGTRSSWLDACNAWKAGGKWCHYHSDWVIGQCLALAANTTCAWQLAQDEFEQNVGDQSGTAARCMADKVACHGSITVAELVAGYTSSEAATAGR